MKAQPGWYDVRDAFDKAWWRVFAEQNPLNTWPEWLYIERYGHKPPGSK
jgi:hypothetical protein